MIPIVKVPNQPVQLVADLFQSLLDARHPIVVLLHPHTHRIDLLCLQLLHLRLTALDLRHYDECILEFSNCFLEIHVSSLHRT